MVQIWSHAWQQLKLLLSHLFMKFSLSDPGIQLAKYNINCINGIYYTIIVAIMLKLETAVKCVQYLCAVFKITSENWIFGV